MARMLPPVLQVALGGALGASLRYGVGVQLARPGFPVAVLAVNVAGSFAMGVLAVWMCRVGLGAWQPLVLTGILGGFTTFSAFSLETVALIERGQAAQASAYVLASVGCSVAALALGLGLARAFG